MSINSKTLGDLQTFNQEFLSSGSIIGLDAERVIIGWGERLWRASSKENGGCSFYFPDFFLENRTPWCTHENHAVISKVELQSALQPNLTSPKSSMRWIPLQKHLFDEVFCDLKKQLQDGALKKAVPFVYESADVALLTEQLKNSLINALHYAQSSPVHVYGFAPQECARSVNRANLSSLNLRISFIPFSVNALLSLTPMRLVAVFQHVLCRRYHGSSSDLTYTPRSRDGATCFHRIRGFNTLQYLAYCVLRGIYSTVAFLLISPRNF